MTTSAILANVLQSNYQIMHTNAYFFFCQCLIEVDQLIQFFFHLNNNINKSFEWCDIPHSALTMIPIFFFRVCVDTVDKLKAKKKYGKKQKAPSEICIFNSVTMMATIFVDNI